MILLVFLMSILFGVCLVAFSFVAMMLITLSVSSVAVGTVFAIMRVVTMTMSMLFKELGSGLPLMAVTGAEAQHAADHDDSC